MQQTWSVMNAFYPGTFSRRSYLRGEPILFPSRYEETEDAPGDPGQRCQKPEAPRHPPGRQLPRRVRYRLVQESWKLDGTTRNHPAFLTIATEDAQVVTYVRNNIPCGVHRLEPGSVSVQLWGVTIQNAYINPDRTKSAWVESLCRETPPTNYILAGGLNCKHPC